MLKGQAKQWGATWPTPHGFNGQDKDGGYGTGGEFEKFCKLWATPDTFNRKSRKALTASTDNGRRSGGGNSSPPGLEQMAELHAGAMPPEMEGIALPPATRSLIASLWATPSAGVFNDAESPESWHQRADALKQKGINGNGAGTPLGIQAQESAALWSTPASRDYRGANTAESQLRRKGNETRTQQLANQVVHEWADPTTLPAWLPCPCCEDFLCTIHRMHAHDCECPAIEEWETDPYTAGPASPQAPVTETAGSDSSSSTPTSRLQLNERFVEVLMNLPPGWTCVCARASTGSGV